MPKQGDPSNEITPAAEFEPVYQRISAILAQARGRVWQAVNTAMVAAYWEIGRTIVEEEQRGDGCTEDDFSRCHREWARRDSRYESRLHQWNEHC